MDYQRIYDSIIAKFQGVTIEGYTERHHIVPRSMGGDNSPANLVDLRARYHFVAHLCLAKIYGGKLIHAAWRMSNYKLYTSRSYDWLKRKSAAYSSSLASARTGEKNPMYGRRGILSPHFGKKYSQERRDKIAKGKVGKSLSAETRAKISLARKGQKVSDETRQKMSQAKRGQSRKPISAEQKALLSRIRSGTKASDETKEKMRQSQIARWARKKEALCRTTPSSLS